MGAAQVELILDTGSFVLRHTMQSAAVVAVVVARAGSRAGRAGVALAAGSALGLSVAVSVAAGLAQRDPADGVSRGVSALATGWLVRALLAPERGACLREAAAALVVAPRVMELALAVVRSGSRVRMLDTDLLTGTVAATVAAGVAAGTGIMLAREAQLGSRAMRGALSLALSTVMLQDLVSAIRVALAFGLLPVSPGLLRFLGPLMDARDGFLYALLLPIAGLQARILWKARGRSLAGTPARARVARAALRSERRAAILVLSAVGTTVALTVGAAASESGRMAARALTAATPVEVREGVVRLATAALRDGKLHRYGYTAADGTVVRFVAIHKGSGQYGIALDACEICGPTGYVELPGGEVLCRACEVVLSVPTVGQPGGCNPIPLAHSLRQGNVEILASEMEAAAPKFR